MTTEPTEAETRARAKRAIDAALYLHHNMISTDAAENIIAGLSDSDLTITPPPAGTVFSDEDLRALRRVCGRSDHQWRDSVLRKIDTALRAALEGE